MRVLALQSVLMWPKRSQREHSLSVLLFHPLPFAQIMPRFGEDSLAVSGSQTVQFSILTFDELVATGIVIAGIFIQTSHHHWSKTTGATVDDCDSVCPHLCVVSKTDAAVLSTLSRSVGHMERRMSMSHIFACSWCLCSRFSQAWIACEKSPVLETFGGDKIYLLSSKLRPPANGS